MVGHSPHSRILGLSRFVTRPRCPLNGGYPQNLPEAGAWSVDPDAALNGHSDMQRLESMEYGQALGSRSSLWLHHFESRAVQAPPMNARCECARGFDRTNTGVWHVHHSFVPYKPWAVLHEASAACMLWRAG